MSGNAAGPIAALTGLAAFGTFFAVTGYRGWRGLRAMKDGIEAEGVVEELDPPGLKPSGTSRYLKVSYSDRANVRQTAIIAISSRFGGAVQQGQAIRITYSTADPRWARHGGAVRDSARLMASVGAMAMGMLVAAIGLGLLTVLLIRLGRR